MIHALLVLAAVALPPQSETWLKADAGGFRILSNASRPDTERIARELVAEGGSPIVTRVFILRDIAALGIAIDPNGALFSGDNENVLFVQAGAGLRAEPVRTPAPQPVRIEPKVDLQPAARAEVLAVLGHLFARISNEMFVDAEIFLSEALQLDPTLPLAHLGLAHINSVLGMRTASDAHYAKAGRSDDAHVLVLYGAELLARVGETKSREDVARARRIFERAAEIDPQSARALAGLGATYVVSAGDPGPGIAALEKSLAMAPAQDDAAVNLTTLLARAGRGEEARRLFDTVVSRSRNPDIVRLGRSALDRLQEKLDAESLLESQVKIVESAMAAAGAGRFEEALKTIDDVLPAIKDAEFKGSVERLRVEIVAKASGRRP
ncbi:MAG TPA: tetratricopeptide repeat protein [Thermoanaerobaculia bacterium]|nr:tetratricopeptide repeat protein [Thermoanaerobaculia bacterium]